MVVSMCMGNSKNKAQCEKCARFPKSIYDEDEAKGWIKWQDRRTSCDMFMEPETDDK